MLKLIGLAVILCLVIAGAFWIIDNIGWRNPDNNNGD